MASTILLLEDDALFAETIEEFLEEANFKVLIARDGEEAETLTFQQRFDLYLLDINVPKIDGLELLKSLRESGDRTPAIFITSHNTKERLLEGYASGCDDYVKKPCDLDELVCKIRALLHRVYGSRENFVEIDNEYEFDCETQGLYYRGEMLPIGRKEQELLKILLLDRGNIVPKEVILSEVWSEEGVEREGSLRVYINSLKKIFGERIENIRGVGYRFKR